MKVLNVKNLLLLLVTACLSLTSCVHRPEPIVGEFNNCVTVQKNKARDPKVRSPSSCDKFSNSPNMLEL